MTEIKTKEKNSYSQVLNVDNSILLDINFDEIDPPLDNPNKRKLKEIISNEHDNGTIFKTPQSVRKRKRRISHADETRRSKESSLVSKTSISSEISSQDILKCIAIDNLELTQTNESLNELEHDDEYSNVITNPTTNSQYIENRLQRNPETESSSHELSSNQSKEINDDCEHAAKNKTPKQVSKYKKLLPVSSFAFREMGSFFGLTKHQKAFILQTKNIEKLYEWQEECLGLRAIHDRSNLIYALPTSGGKTLVAEIAMIREVLLRKRNVIFVLPYVSIVQEKINDLMPFAVEFDFLLEEYCAGKGSIPPIKRRKKNTIFISTIEKSQILFDSLYENNRLNEVGMIVVDELHMLGDEKRGYHLEVLLSKAVFHKQPHIQIIAMSATISNLKEIARFLNADVYTREFRPVELKEYVKIGSDIFSVDGKTRYISDAFKVSRNDFGKEYTRQMLKRDPDHLAALSLEIIPKSSCLIFCATKQNCENVAKLLTELLPQELIEWKKEEKSTLMEHIKADANGRICPILAKTIPFGIAYHHSGMTNDERKHLEEAYRCNIICIICCTSTLAAGVNLPARRVIIRSPYVGQHFLTLSRYKQMIGRAGRAGKCSSGESILVCDPKDYQKLTTLLCSKMDETISGFVQDVSGMFIETVILNLIGTKVATSIDDLIDFFKCSLLSVQIHRTETNLRENIVNNVKMLMNKGALVFTSTSNGERHPSFVIDEDCESSRKVFPDDLLEVSQVGMAAVNAGMSFEEGRRVESALQKAQMNFVLTQCLHLLYIVTPNDIADTVKPNYSLFNKIIMQMNSSTLNTAKVIGISESLAMRMITSPSSIKMNEMSILKRFYVALIIYDLWNGNEIYHVSEKFKISRGVVYSLMNSTSSNAYSILRFCEKYEDFWMFKEILDKFSKRLCYCCSTELLELMELPAVKIGRAKLMYAAGFKTIEDVASVMPAELVKAIKNLNMRQADQIVKYARYQTMAKIGLYQDRLEEMKNVIKHKK